jgi:hypothetical protein
MIIIMSFSDTLSLSSVRIFCITAAIFRVSVLVELGAYADRPVL